MTNYAFLPLLLAITIWPESASAEWRWVVEQDRFDDSKPANCAAIQNFANGRIMAFPPKKLAEYPKLLIFVDSTPVFEQAAENAQLVNLEGCSLSSSAKSHHECLQLYLGNTRQANLLMRVGKGVIQKVQICQVRNRKGRVLHRGRRYFK